MFAARLSSPRRLETKPICLPHGIGGVGRIDLPAVERDMAGRDRDLAEDRPADGVMAGAAQADQPQDLAGRDLEGDRPDRMRRRRRSTARTIRSEAGAA